MSVEEVSIELEASLTLEERLGKQRWYLGELTQEAAESLLNTRGLANSFIVYTEPDTHQYALSARFLVDGIEGGIVEHLAITATDDDHYQLAGQSESYQDLIQAVNSYTFTCDPPLLPALGTSFETQVSISDAPPEYDKANKVLKPDIAPLPNIGNIRVADRTAVEAKSGRISPSEDQYIVSSSNNNRRVPPAYLNRSIWVRYLDYHRCHPKNVCYGCCYRPVRWTGYRVSTHKKWYNPCGSGPLRALGIIFGFWLFCWICFGCYHCWRVLCICCCYICCGGWDSS